MHRGGTVAGQYDVIMDHGDKLRGATKHNCEGRHAHLQGRTGRRRIFPVDDRQDMWEVESRGSCASVNQVVTAVEERLFMSDAKATATPTKLHKHKEWDEVVDILERDAVRITKKIPDRRGGEPRDAGEVKHYFLEPT